MSLQLYSLMVVPHENRCPENFVAQTVHFWNENSDYGPPPSSDGRCAEIRKNSASDSDSDK